MVYVLQKDELSTGTVLYSLQYSYEHCTLHCSSHAERNYSNFVDIYVRNYRFESDFSSVR